MKNIIPEKCVVLDLETTGNQAHAGDQIIQIGLCVLEQGKIVEQYATLVKPTKKIPPFIEKLTGITNADVSGSPSIEEVISDVLLRLDDAILIAHNVHFDLGFLQYTLEELGYPSFSGLIIDTVELARIFLPLQQGYKLEQLADDFEIEHEHPHQADSDAFATAHLFLLLMDKMRKLPLMTIQRLIPLAHFLYSDIEVLLRRVERDKLQRKAENRAIAVEGEWFFHRQLALKNKMKVEQNSTELKPNLELEGELDSLSVAQIISEVMLDYEHRAGQEELVQLIVQAFRNEEHGLFEVGTGTGKTLAYLISSLTWAKQRGEKVVVSTYTILLQEQIMEKEIPLLKEALPFSFSAQLLKGRNNYLCLRKFEASLLTNTENNYDFVLTKMQMLVWLTVTETGDVEELNLPSGGKEFWQLVQSDSSSCINVRCPWYEQCFYYRARQRAQGADLVITNHALLLADAQIEQQILPPYQYLVIDEAHHLEHLATEQYGKSSQYKAIHFLINRLTFADKPSLALQLLDLLPLVSTEDSLAKKVEEMAFQAEQLKMEIDQLFTSLVDFAEKQREGHTEGNIRFISIEMEEKSGELWTSIVQQVEEIHWTVQELQYMQHLFLKELEKVADELSFSQQGITTDWNGAMERLEKEMNNLVQFFYTTETNKLVKWIEYEHKGAKNSATLRQRPLQVSDVLQKSLFQQKRSIILTSATLQVNKSFEYMKTELGLAEERLITRIVESPFQYAEQATLLIPNYVGIVGDAEEKKLTKELAQEIVEMAILTQGRMMVLFTSYQSLRLTYSELKEELSTQGIFLLAQGIDSSSRGKLTKNFQSKEKAVLLGTSSFWEGIDIPGEELSCLVIVKLPFSPPHTPYYQAKIKQLKEEGKNPFIDYALPQAVIRFKQGFGRLIRKRTDKGVIVVYDRRILEAKYGKLFLKSLPSIGVHSVNKKSLHQELRRWLGEQIN